MHSSKNQVYHRDIFPRTFECRIKNIIHGYGNDYNKILPAGTIRSTNLIQKTLWVCESQRCRMTTEGRRGQRNRTRSCLSCEGLRVGVGVSWGNGRGALSALAEPSFMCGKQSTSHIKLTVMRVLRTKATLHNYHTSLSRSLSVQHLRGTESISAP